MNKSGEIMIFFKRKITPLLIFLFASSAMVNAEEAKQEEGKVDIQKVSEAFGHLIGKNLDSLGFEFDIAQVVKGMQDASAGKSSPLTENECIQLISEVQEQAFQKLAQKNLDEANAFMASNQQEKDIVTVEKNKLHYKVEKTGDGALVEEHFSPMIRYVGHFADGKVFGASQEDELISLDETIPGFTKGIVGMKEGEKRTLYIHPELGYGTTGYLPPNSLLVFDIEVVKANVAPENEGSLSAIHSEESLKELALPAQKTDQALR